MYLPSDNPTSLVAWFRRGVGVTSSGGFASAWADQSGNGRDLLQANGAHQPAYDGSAVLTFDGVSDRMEAVFALNQPHQVSMLMNLETVVAGRVFFDGSVAYAQVFVANATPTLSAYAGASAITSDTLSAATYHALTTLFNGASSSITIDGGSPATGNPGALNPGGFLLAMERLYVGPSNISVKEIILRNVDDATIRANDHTYLRNLQSDVAPVADFSGTPLTGVPGVSVAFTDLSTNSPREWLWDFGDGDTATTQNPTHSYAFAGSYTVVLTATNYGGSSIKTRTNYVVVAAPADAPIRNYSLRNWRNWKRRDLEEGELPAELRDEADQAVREATQASAELSAGNVEAANALAVAMQARESYEEAYRQAYQEAYVAEVVAELWKADMRKLRRRRAAALLLLH